MPYHPFLGYPSVSRYIFTSLIELKTRDEIVNTLVANGYTKRQARNFYRKNLVRFFAYREKLVPSEV
jgi:hypothetical protein